MGSIDYVKHAACYTKWHTSDAENIDMELTSPPSMAHVSHHPRMYPREHWLAGTKGRLIKVLSLACVFCIGLVLGSSARRPIQRNVTLHQSHCDLLPREPYQMSDKILKKLIDSVSRENIESWLWQTTRDFHVGGSDKGAKLAQKIKATWTSHEMKNVRVEIFRPLLSYPDMERANDVRLTKGSRVIYQLKASHLESQLETHPYMAYSSPGKVRGKPVYVNFGQSEDFDVLKSRGVTLNGTIAIMRYGKGQTLAKIKRAEENGIQGVLIYADPFDTESLDTEVPSGPAVPSDAVERGNIKSFPGDPVTPFLPATDDIYRMPRSDVQLPGIPVQPISAEDAQHLLRGIGGPSAPIRWQGRLNLSYNIGPGYKDAAEMQVL
ncbi:N-acetylated-alpha-linked acidic dipeptidase 2-like [Galendromus occidentalis]|uniref:N-acetylated-alpha-linked acidic dipeptidase 2-like n=1 Tax=Galendromus occidentalis TaxID=34638 RepID=A0AAJ7WI07_9ACAR|nr:N-acetylated-alpha-linked acidic dipeptidase 2-like [Galendromus occidentalis]